MSITVSWRARRARAAAAAAAVALYDEQLIQAVPTDISGFSLGCGDPITLANLQPDRTPLQADFLIGDPVEESPLVEAHPDVSEFEGKSPEERWRSFEKEVSRCIRCYACREACPMCYCAECFVDSSRPKWIEKSLSPSALTFYHMVRAFHQTGRCSGCGACERACPMDIRLTHLTQKLNQEVKDLYGFEAGIPPDVPPPLSTFNPEDEQEFIK